MWITLTESDIQATLSGPELTALKTAALAAGQSDPLPDILARVTREVRGYVAGCDKNTLGDGDTIPDELEGAAVALARYYLCTRLPVRLLTEERKEEYRSALTLLRDVAACRYAIVQPATASAEIISKPTVQVASSRTRIAGNSNLNGL